MCPPHNWIIFSSNIVKTAALFDAFKNCLCLLDMPTTPVYQCNSQLITRCLPPMFFSKYAIIIII